jgi:hypothetical protein
MSSARLTALLMIAALTILSATACGRVASRAGAHRAEGEGGVAEATADPGAGQGAELDGDGAIRLVKQMIDQSGLTVRLATPYAQTQMKSVVCSPQEVDTEQSANPHNPELWRCKSASGEPPFTKPIATTTTQCCRTTTVPIRSSEISNWRAEPASDDKWTVYADYSVYGQSYHSSWLVDRKTLRIGPQKDG